MAGLTVIAVWKSQRKADVIGVLPTLFRSFAWFMLPYAMFGWLASSFKKREDRRETTRVSPINAYVRIDSHTFAVDDLDEHHFRILEYQGGLIEGQRFEFHFIFQFMDGSRDAFPGHGRVIRIDELGLAAAFAESQPLFRKAVHDFIVAQPKS